MSESKPQAASREELEARIRTEILPLFDAALRGGQAVYRNPNMHHCWEAIEAEPSRCRAIEGSDLPEDGLFDLAGPSGIAGSPPNEACDGCPLISAVRPTIVEELGEAFNTLIHHLSDRNDLIRNATDLTRSLASSLEDMDHENRVIRTQMIRDVLTGLFNRHHMNERLLQEVERCQGRSRRLTVLMLDLDDFKVFNDTFGHLEGDKILARFGRHLRECTRDYDMAFRYGGEEFLVLLPETGTDDAMVVAERIRQGFADLVFEVPSAKTREGRSQSMTVSCGLAEYRQGQGALEFLEVADQALYEAKRAGKNRIEVFRATVPV